MKNVIVIILVCMCLMVPVMAQRSEHNEGANGPCVRFAPLHIYLDSGTRPLAAFQFELQATTGRIKIVGVEGGQHTAYKKPPYYDPAALANDRIIIAGFNTGGELPTGRTRIATIHLQIIGDVEPDYEVKLTVAADADGKEIPTEVTFGKGEQK